MPPAPRPSGGFGRSFNASAMRASASQGSTSSSEARTQQHQLLLSVQSSVRDLQAGQARMIENLGGIQASQHSMAASMPGAAWNPGQGASSSLVSPRKMANDAMSLEDFEVQVNTATPDYENLRAYYSAMAGHLQEAVFIPAYVKAAQRGTGMELDLIKDNLVEQTIEHMINEGRASAEEWALNTTQDVYIKKIHESKPLRKMLQDMRSKARSSVHNTIMKVAVLNFTGMEFVSAKDLDEEQVNKLDALRAEIKVVGSSVEAYSIDSPGMLGDGSKLLMGLCMDSSDKDSFKKPFYLESRYDKTGKVTGPHRMLVVIQKLREVFKNSNLLIEDLPADQDKLNEFIQVVLMHKLTVCPPLDEREEDMKLRYRAAPEGHVLQQDIVRFQNWVFSTRGRCPVRHPNLVEMQQSERERQQAEATRRSVSLASIQQEEEEKDPANRVRPKTKKGKRKIPKRGNALGKAVDAVNPRRRRVITDSDDDGNGEGPHLQDAGGGTHPQDNGVGVENMDTQNSQGSTQMDLELLDPPPLVNLHARRRDQRAATPPLCTQSLEAALRGGSVSECI